jgi:SAM-dependent methyltransferase
MGLTRFRPIGLAAELAWWERWLLTKGGPWPDEYRARLDPSRELSPLHQQLLAEAASEPLRILDVGSGPLTSVGLRHPSRAVEITAVDPRFGAARFDLVHARNCIDHSADPVLAIRQMVAVARPGAFVHLLHHEDEAESRGHSALHQWNFRADNGAFVIWGEATCVDVGKLLGDGAHVTCRITGDGWVEALIRKAGD